MHSPFRFSGLCPLACLPATLLLASFAIAQAPTAPKPTTPAAAPAAAPAPAPVTPAAADATPPGAFHVGGLDLQLPSPAPELAEGGADIRTVLEVLAPDQNRLVAAYVTGEDAARLHTGGATLARYALVEAPRRAEFVDVTPENFKEVTDTMEKQFGSILDTSVKDGEDQLNRRLKALNLNDTKVTLDKPVQLGTFLSRTDAYGVGLMLPVSAQGTTVKMAAGVLILRVRNRLLYGYLYTVYKDEDSVKWIAKSTSDWADAIQAANAK